MTRGIQTTEFWVTIITQVIALAAMAGVVEPAQSDSLTKSIIAIVGGVISIVTAVSYVWGRTWLKKQ